MPVALPGLSTNQIIEIGEGPDRRPLRVLFINERRGEAALFDVTDPAALPVWMTFDEIASLIMDGQAHPLRDDPYLPRLLPDSDLSSAAKQTRDKRLAAIRPLAQTVEDGDMPILRAERRGAMMEEAIAKHGVGKANMYAWLRLWWRFGQIDNALLPSFHKCGTGERQQVLRKLGRPLSTSKLDLEHVGANVDDAMRRLLIRGAKLFWSARLRTHYQSQNVTVAAMQMAEKKVWAHRS